MRERLVVKILRNDRAIAAFDAETRTVLYTLHDFEAKKDICIALKRAIRAIDESKEDE